MLPKPIARPLDMARDRARLFVTIEGKLESHPVISAHIEEVLENINTHTPTLPPAIQARKLSSKGEFSEAISLWKQVYEEEPTNALIAHHYADALAGAGKDEELIKFIPGSSLSIINKTYFLLRARQDQEVIDLATKILAKPTMANNEDSAFLIINRAIALKRLGRTEEMMSDLEFLEQNIDSAETAIKAGVAALKEEKEKMFIALKDALHKTIQPENLMVFPVFEDYRDDPDFLNFVKKENESSTITPT